MKHFDTFRRLFEYKLVLYEGEDDLYLLRGCAVIAGDKIKYALRGEP